LPRPRDDAPLFKTDPYLTLIAPEDGDYRILIREAAYEGSEQSNYRLHIGTHPRPHMVFPLGGKPGEAINFTFIGDPTGTFTQTATLTSDPTFPLFPTLNNETAPAPIPVLVSSLEHSAQPDGNTDFKTAHPFPPIPSAVDGILDEKGEARWFRFTAKKDQNLDIKVIARALRSPLDAVLNLRERERKGLANNDDDQLSPDIRAFEHHELALPQPLGRGPIADEDGLQRGIVPKIGVKRHALPRADSGG
jgi:hypothetical protein